MEDNLIKKLLQEKYSVKQMLGYFIIGYNNTIDKIEFEEILTNVTTSIIDIDKSILMEKIDVKYIQGIDLYWALNIEQIISYGYIVFRNLTFSRVKFEIEDIIEEFLIIAKIYSPDNATEYVRKKIKG